MSKIFETFKQKCPTLKKCVLETIIGVVVLALLTNFIYVEVIDKWINPHEKFDDNRSYTFSGNDGDVNIGGDVYMPIIGKQ